MNNDNPWKYVRVDPDSVKSNRYLHPTRRDPPRGDGDDACDTDTIDGKFILLPVTDTYALGVHALRQACVNTPSSPHPQFTLDEGGSVYRPLTFKEVIKARLEDLATADSANKLRLFDMYIDSSTGIANQAGSTKFKLISRCQPLIGIASDFSDEFVSVDYNSLNGTEIDSGNADFKYNESLTKTEIENHEGWRAAVEGDVSLLIDYRDAVFAALKERDSDDKMPEKAMGFYVLQDTEEDELRALFVNYLDNYSDADGYNLSGSGSFLLVAPQSP